MAKGKDSSCVSPRKAMGMKGSGGGKGKPKPSGKGGKKGY